MRKQNKVENIEQCAKQQERAKKVLKDLEDNSKKASPEIIQYCKNIDKKFNGFSTYVKCWEFIAEYHKLWGNLETNNNEMTFDILKRVCKKINEFEVMNVVISGGECTEHSNFIDVFHYLNLKCKNCIFTITSNGINFENNKKLYDNIM